MIALPFLVLALAIVALVVWRPERTVTEAELNRKRMEAHSMQWVEQVEANIAQERIEFEQLSRRAHAPMNLLPADYVSASRT